MRVRFLTVFGCFLASALAEGAGAQSSARPLPENNPCPYPARAREQLVAGFVEFAMDVQPDGTAGPVEVRRVPMADLGFEDTVRECLSRWRFEPASTGETGLRRHEGRIAFRLDPSNEEWIRDLVKALAAAWNTAEKEAVEALAVRADDGAPSLPPERTLRAQLEGRDTAGPWHMELEPGIEYVRFLAPDFVALRQRYRRVAPGQTGQTATPEEGILDAYVAKGSRGWRFVSVSATQGMAKLGGILRAGGQIREPRKIKDVRPKYPEAARQRRSQGSVILECVISPEGEVTDLKVLYRTDPILGAAAVEAVRQWRYTPTLLFGQPVPVIMTITVNFRLT